MALLCMHLAHGVSSIFQSLGLSSDKYGDFLAKVGPAVAVVIFIGNTSIPLAVMLGLVQGG